VIGWDLEKHITLQYEGLGYELEKDESEKYKKLFLKKRSPCSQKFLNHSKSRLFKIKPVWISYSDYTKKKPKVSEFNF